MNDIRYWLALRQISGLDWRWLQHDFLPTYTLAQLFAEPKHYLSSPQLCKRLQTVDWASVDKEVTWTGHDLQHRITFPDPAYPPCLRHLDTPPAVLYVEGQLDALLSPQIAIVGTRHPSHAGMETTRQFAKDLADIGLSITSGLAHGIDAAAHQGALSVHGKTVAVMGTGIHHCYPKQHLALAKQITKHGALISELPPDAPPLAAHFPLRNRIITGLSIGVVVIEAALKSGSLISARLANEQGRLVMVVPGSIYNPQTQGCHWLLKQGAVLVTSAADIIEELPSYLTQTLEKSPKISTLDRDPTGADQKAKGTYPKDFELRQGARGGQGGSVHVVHDRPGIPMGNTVAAQTAKGIAKGPSNMVQYLSLEPRSVEDMMMLSGKPVTIVQTELALLVLSGHAELIAGGYVLNMKK